MKLVAHIQGLGNKMDVGVVMNRRRRTVTIIPIITMQIIDRNGQFNI